MIMLLECPNCARLWYDIEIDRQQCNSCNYPNGDEFFQCADDTDFEEIYNEVYGNCIDDLPF